MSIGSYHLKRGDYCEVNPGIGVEHEISPPVRLLGGTYQNSLCDVSNYFGVSWLPLRGENWKLGIATLAVTGYEDEKKKGANKFLIAPLPTVSYEGLKWGVNFVVIPPFGKDFQGALGFQLKFKL